ncbi:hypothetical protein [Burkholderia cepacia]|uniref:hypothetical protein n=1 Tax=Burkholderia cepacia TaxID=292 RepID=UPI002ABE76E0|nr:hypothetical protein [Burkholderia cepacia]
MTLGELARLFNACLHIGVAVTLCHAPATACANAAHQRIDAILHGVVQWQILPKHAVLWLFHADVISRRDSAGSRASSGDLPEERGALQPIRTLRTGGVSHLDRRSVPS